MESHYGDHIQIDCRRKDTAVLVICVVAAHLGASRRRENADLFPFGIQLCKFLQCLCIAFFLVRHHCGIAAVQLFQFFIQFSGIQRPFPFCNCHHFYIPLFFQTSEKCMVTGV